MNGIVNVTYSKLAVIVHVHYGSLGDDHIKICQESFGLSTMSQMQERYLPLNAKPQTTPFFHIHHAKLIMLASGRKDST